MTNDEVVDAKARKDASDALELVHGASQELVRVCQLLRSAAERDNDMQQQLLRLAVLVNNLVTEQARLRQDLLQLRQTAQELQQLQQAATGEPN